MLFVHDACSLIHNESTALRSRRNHERHAATTATRYLAPDWFTRRVFNPLVARLTRWGISVKGSRVLEVRGRTSGEVRTTVVNLLTVDGVRYLVAPRGETQWVRNLRADGGAARSASAGATRRSWPRSSPTPTRRRCSGPTSRRGRGRSAGSSTGSRADSPDGRRRGGGARVPGVPDRLTPADPWSVDRLGRLHPPLELRRLGADEVVRVGVDLLELDLAGEDRAASTPGARPRVAWNSGMTSVANSSRLRRCRSWVFVPAWFSRITWSTFDSSNLRSLRADRLGRADQPAGLRLLALRACFRNAWYSSHRLTVPGSHRAVRRRRSAGRTGRTSSRRPCALRLLVGRRRT